MTDASSLQVEFGGVDFFVRFGSFFVFFFVVVVATIFGIGAASNVHVTHGGGHGHHGDFVLFDGFMIELLGCGGSES